MRNADCANLSQPSRPSRPTSWGEVAEFLMPWDLVASDSPTAQHPDWVGH